MSPDYAEILRLHRKYRESDSEPLWRVFVRIGQTLERTMPNCEQCSEPMEGPHHPGCYLYVDPPSPPPVSAEDLIPLFRDAASVNMTEESVERQARRFAEAVISLYHVRHK